MATQRDRKLLPKQAAHEIGMSVQWLRKMIREGKGPPYKIRGRIILIDIDDLRKWDQNPVIR